MKNQCCGNKNNGNFEDGVTSKLPAEKKKNNMTLESKKWRALFVDL